MNWQRTMEVAKLTAFTLGIMFASPTLLYSQLRTEFSQNWVRTHPFQIIGWANSVDGGSPSPWLFGPSGCNTVLVHEVGAMGGGEGTIASHSSLSHPWHFNLNATSLTQSIQDRVDELYGDYPHGQGWYIYDEPNCDTTTTSDLLGMEDVGDWLKSNYPDHLIYGNILAYTTENMYKVDNYVNVVEPDVLMYDWYPFWVGYEAQVEGHFNYAMAYRAKGLYYNIPYFSYLQAIDNVSHRPGSESEMRWDAFSKLTMGYKGLAYYHYSCDTYSGLVDGTTSTTTMYDIAADMNPEIESLGNVLTSATSTDVRYIRSLFGRTAPSSLSYWSSGAGSDSHITNIQVLDYGYEKNGLIGFFEDDNGEELFMLTNLNHGSTLSADSGTVSFRLTFDSTIDDLLCWDRITNRQMVVELNNHILDVDLPGGTGNLYKYNNGEDFIHYVPPPDTPVNLHFSFDSNDISGSTVLDSSQNYNDATLSGGFSSVDGVRDEGGSFSSGGYAIIDTPSDLVADGDDFTVSFWLKTADWDGTNGLIFAQNANGIGYTIGLHDSSDGLIIKTDFGSTTLGGIELGSLTDNEFTHFSLVFDSDNGIEAIYLNGTTETSTINNGWNIGDSGVASLMGRIVGGYPEYRLTGTLDEFVIHNSKLSDLQAKELYDPTPSYVHYSFDSADISGSTVFDSSLTGNNASISGSITTVTGVYGEAASFSSGAYAVIDTPGDLAGDGDDFVVDFWLKVADWDDTNGIIFAQNANGIGCTIGLHDASNGVIVKTDFGSTTLGGINLASLGSNEFAHFSFLFDDEDGLKKIYLNGELQTSTINNGWNIGDSGIASLMGRIVNSSPEYRLTGVLDEFVIYKLPQAPMLVYYSFDSDYTTSTTIMDTSHIVRNDAFVSDGSITSVAGELGEAGSFSDGAFATIESTSGLAGEGDDFTITFWLKVADWDGTNGLIFSQNANDIAFTIGLHDASDGLIIKTDFGTTTMGGIELDGLTDNEFSHFAIVFDDEDGIEAIYLNGDEETSTINNGWNFGDEGIASLMARIIDGSSDYTLTGILDDFSIFKGKLSEAQIEDIMDYTAASAVPEPNSLVTALSALCAVVFLVIGKNRTF